MVVVVISAVVVELAGSLAAEMRGNIGKVTFLLYQPRTRLLSAQEYFQ